ncbi:MAG TPA: hypothetical protein VFR46_12090 [Actinomycetes bacterium]|nr:hypothetical protein [Actinomycetes bacterium]
MTRKPNIVFVLCDNVVRVKARAATVEVAAESDDAELLLGPYRPPAE